MANPPAVPNADPPIYVRPDGSISGIEGMLDQITNSLVRQIRVELLPVLQADKHLQTTLGRGIGSEVAKPIWVLVSIAGAYAVWKVYRRTRRPNPRRTIISGLL
jgi:hypothetical protein